VLSTFTKLLVSPWCHITHSGGFIGNYFTLSKFQGIIDLDPVISAVSGTVTRINNEQLPLLPEMKELRGGDGIIGDARNDDLDGHVRAEFTDSSESDEEYELGV
jgi:hypothetical protein